MRSTVSCAGTRGTCVSASRTAWSSGMSLHPQPGYPFSLDARRSSTSCRRGGLTVRTTATNVGRDRLPLRQPAHIRTSRSARRRSTTCCSRCPRERCSARTIVASRSAAVPVGETDLDFRVGAPSRRHEARPRLHRPRARRYGCWPASSSSAGERGVTLWLDDGYRYLMVFTGDLPDVGRGGLAVEPMTCRAECLPERRGSRRTRAGRVPPGDVGAVPDGRGGRMSGLPSER